MNKRNILKVAKAIEAHSIARLGFNMEQGSAKGLKDYSGHRCKTTACIAGWAVAVSQELSPSALVKRGVLDDAAEWMGLTRNTARTLFCPTENEPGNPYEATPAHAVAVLRHLAKTGKVDWSIQP